MPEGGYAAEYQPVVLSGVTELLVHGVGGESPANTLEEPHPIQVAGDGIAGFHRGPDVDGRHREVYSWGGLTSGAASRALWVVLLPFALANLAGWMERRHPSDPEGRWFRRMVRLFGLTVTLLALLYVCSIAFDLIAYQCGGESACSGGERPAQPWYSPVRWVWILQAGFLDDSPFRRLVLAALVPLAVVGLLGFLARSTRQRYERAKPAAVAATEARGEDPFAMDMEIARTRGLDAPWFWYGEPLARALGRAHLAAAIAVTAWALAAATASLGATGLLIDGGKFLAWAVLGVAVVAMWVESPFDRWDLRGLPSAGLVALALVAAGAWFQPTSRFEARALRDLGGVAEAVYAVHLVLLVLLLADAVRRSRAARRQRADGSLPSDALETDTLRAGPVAAAILASVLLNAVLAGLSIRIADALGSPLASGAPLGDVDPPVIRYPRVYDLFAIGFVAGLLFVAVRAFLAWRQTGRAVPAASILDDYLKDQEAPPPEEDATASALPREDAKESDTDLEHSRRGWVDGIRRGRRLADLITRLDDVLLTVVFFTITLAGVAFVVDLITEPLRVPRQVPWWVTWFCTWAVALVPAGLIGLILSGYRNQGRRRQIGILWDVAMFWPRAFHPLAPPSYAERAVPDLQRRLHRLTTDRPGGRRGRVLLMAHSQGTVLAVAALLQPSPPAAALLDRVGLVTYGAPLARLYRRAFPAYFGGRALAALHGAFGGPPGSPGRWRNFHRDTDLIGGPVFTPPDQVATGGDVRLRDPATSRYVPGEPLPRVRGHSGYMRDPAMRAHVNALASQLLYEVAQPPPAAARPGRLVRDPGP
jgi:hypothetical protein